MCLTRLWPLHRLNLLDWDIKQGPVVRIRWQTALDSLLISLCPCWFCYPSGFYLLILVNVGSSFKGRGWSPSVSLTFGDMLSLLPTATPSAPPRTGASWCCLLLFSSSSYSCSSLVVHSKESLSLLGEKRGAASSPPHGQLMSAESFRGLLHVESAPRAQAPESPQLPPSLL